MSFKDNDGRTVYINEREAKKLMDSLVDDGVLRIAKKGKGVLDTSLIITDFGLWLDDKNTHLFLNPNTPSSVKAQIREQYRKDKSTSKDINLE